MRLGNAFLGRFAPVNEGCIHVRGNDQQVAVQLLREQGGGQVFVDHRLNAFEFAVFVVHGRNTAAACTDHDGALFQQPFNRTDFEDAFGFWAGHHTAEFVAIRCNAPAFFSGQALGFRFAVDRANRLGRVLESRVFGVNFNLGQQGGERCVRWQQVAQLLLDHVTDHAFGFSAQHVQRVRADGGVGCGLQGQKADLGAVTVGHDQFVARSDASDLGGGGADVFALIFSGHGLAATQKGVTAQCNDDTHRSFLKRGEGHKQPGSVGASRLAPTGARP